MPRSLDVDAVQDDVEILGYVLDLGILERAERIFDGKRMEMEDVVQQRHVARPAGAGRSTQSIDWRRPGRAIAARPGPLLSCFPFS